MLAGCWPGRLGAVVSRLHVSHSSRRPSGLLHMVVPGSREGGHARPQGSLRPTPEIGTASFPPHSVGQSKSRSQRRFKAGDLDPTPDGKSCAIIVQRVRRQGGRGTELFRGQPQCPVLWREEQGRSQGPRTVSHGCVSVALKKPDPQQSRTRQRKLGPFVPLCHQMPPSQ